MTTDEAAAKNIARMKRVIESMPFAKHLAMELVDAGDGWARLKMRYQDENSTAMKALHGGAISSLIDTTGAMAAWTTAEIATPKYFGSTVGINVIEQKGFILFLAPIMDVPEKNRDGFYRKLLELNHLATEDGAFSIDKESGKVYLRALRSLDSFDFDEFVDMLDTIARVAAFEAVIASIAVRAPCDVRNGPAACAPSRSERT